MRKVTTVVPVLMTSCQVSLKSKMGPERSQTRMIVDAIRKASGHLDGADGHRQPGATPVGASALPD
jgi:hypothetical protein